MSRSQSKASDPTHFTPVTPHASNKIPSTVKLDSRAPPNETPQEKVKRLRERARKAKMAHISPWERVIERGRLWADRMHRATVFGLIGSSVIASGVAVFALSDMIVYNRRRRNEYYKLQVEHRQTVLEAAKAAEADGTATTIQLELLKFEKERLEQEKERKSKGWFTIIREELMGGLQKEDVKGGTMGIGLNDSRTSIESQGNIGLVRGVEEVMDSAKEAIRRDTPSISVVGGPLDQHATKAAQDVEKATKSWWNWVRGG